MPIYEYKCRDCGTHFEKRQSVSDAPLKVCERCQGTLDKQWSLSGFAFKGDGWYVTDYSKKGSGAKSEAGGSSEKPAGEKSSGGESTSSADTASNAKSEATAKSTD